MHIFGTIVTSSVLLFCIVTRQKGNMYIQFRLNRIEIIKHCVATCCSNTYKDGVSLIQFSCNQT